MDSLHQVNHDPQELSSDVSKQDDSLAKGSQCLQKVNIHLLRIARTVQRKAIAARVNYLRTIHIQTSSCLGLLIFIGTSYWSRCLRTHQISASLSQLFKQLGQVAIQNSVLGFFGVEGCLWQQASSLRACTRARRARQVESSQNTTLRLTRESLVRSSESSPRRLDIPSLRMDPENIGNRRLSALRRSTLRLRHPQLCSNANSSISGDRLGLWENPKDLKKEHP